jgi:uncharacterized protein (DUF2267 family)
LQITENSDQEQVHQRIPRLGSEVRFSDGLTAGRIRALNENDFVVIRGKKRIRRIVISYTAISSIGNRVVILRSKKADILEKRGGAISGDKELVSKKKFLKELDLHLKLDNCERVESIARITLYLMSKRLSPNQKRQLKKTLPCGIRTLWATVEQPGTEQYFNMSDFLIPIKNQGRFETMEEAFIAAREVFSSLKRIMASVLAIEISRSLPRGLQEIWESAQ